MRRQAGFTLIEVVLAMALLGASLAALAELLAGATRAGVAAQHASYATLLAERKLEELEVGPVVLAPASALRANTPGFVDHVDAGGLIVGTGTTAPGDALYTRRWSVEAMPGLVETFVIQVSVLASHRASGPAPQTRLPEEARLLSVRRGP